MNKIYRRLWSTARQCWVVASELTAPRGKAASTVRLGLATAVLLMSSPIALSAEQAEDQEERVPLELAEDLQRWALQSAFSAPQGQASFAVVAPAATIYTQLTKVTDSSYRDSTLEGDLSMVVGSRSLVKGTKSVAFGNQVSVLNDSSTAVGHYVRILGGGYAVGVGTNSVADGIGAVAVGHNARAQSGNSIAMGSGASTVKGNAGDSKIAIGGNALAGTDGWTGSVALGGQTRATHDSVAIGYGSRTSSNSSVAIGAHSVAGEAKTVSVGNAEIKRRIVNVDDGVVNSDSYDAVNGRQLQGVKNTVTAVQRVANTAKTTADQALANTKLIQAANTNSTIRIGGENTGGILTISNKNGETRYLNGVRNGTLSATSTDAVTGQQLYATNQRLDAAGRSTATGNVISEANKATATGNLSLAMGQVAKANGVAAMALGHGAVAEAGNAVAIGSASGASGAFAVAVGGGAKATHENSVALGEKSVTTGAKQVSVGNATMKRKIINVDDGAINASSNEAVTGKQMYVESQRVSGLVKQASAGGIMYLGAENTGNVLTVSNKDGGKRYINGVQNATLSASSSDAVTGQQLFTTNSNVTTAQNTANNALGKANALGGLVSQAAADGNVRLGGENTGAVLDVRNKSNANRTLSGVKDGAVNATSTEAVTGKQLNTTNTEVASVRTVATAAQTTANTAKTTADNALGKASTLGGLISQVAADGNVRLGGENTGTVLDVRNKANANRTLSGLKDGAVSATSTEAVTGKQLNTTNTEVAAVRTVATAAQTAANTAKTTADNALGKANTLGGLVSQVAPDGNVRLGGENTGAVLDVRNKANANRTLSGLKDGAVSATSTEAVTGKQLNTTNTEVAAVRTVATAAQTAANTAKTTADNALGKANTLGGLVSQVAPDGNVRLGGENTGTVLDVRNKANANRTLSGLKDGAVNGTSTEAVTGKQLNTTNTEVASVRTVAAAAQTAANAAKSTADNALGKANTLGGLVSQVAADGNVRLGGENTGAVLDVRNKANANRTLSGLKDGAVNATSTEAVTGKQLNTTNAEVAAIRTVATSAQTTANTAKTTADNALGKANTLGGLISQVAADGNVRLGGENTGSVLDVRNKANSNRTLSGLRDGAVNGTSTEAVTGKQLNTTNTEVAAVRTVATSAQTTANTAKTTADNALGKANTLGGLISEVAGDGNVRLGGENTGSVLDVRNKSGGARSLSGLADGTISATSTEAVTGKQLQATHDRLATAQSRADAAHAGATAAQTTANQAKAKADATGNAVATSAVIEDRNRATATGNLAMAMGQAAKANGVAAFAMGHSAIANGNNAVSVGSASAASAKFAVALGGNAKAKHDNSVALGERSETTGINEVSVGNAATDLKRRIVNVDDARLTDSSTDAVTGKQLFATNEKVEANEGVLAGHTSDLAAQSGRIADNRRDLDTLRSEFEDFDPDLDGVVKFAADGSVDIAGGKVRGVAAGDISSATSTDAVNGGQLFETNERLALVERSSSFLAIGQGGSQAPAVSGRFGVALGDSAEASPRDEGAVAVGSYALAWAKNSVALGRSAYVEASAENGFAMGVRSSVEAVDSVAIGASSSVAKGAERSVAIGGGSVASEALTVSFGNDKLLRRLVNVGRGTSDDEAVTLVQLKESLDALGGHAGIDGSGNINAPAYNVQGGTQNNVGDALAALDSAVVTADSRVDNLEGKLRSAFQDGPSVRADGLNQLALAGANGSVLTNLADGRIAAGSRDAVTGSQLFDAKQEIARNRNDLNDLRGERDGLLSRGLMAAEQGNVIDYGGARLTGVADGVISADSRDVVSGRQLFTTNSRVDQLRQRMDDIAIGAVDEDTRARSGAYGVALGAGATASVVTEGATALGAYATAEGKNSVALGRASHVHERAEDGFALGGRSQVEAAGGIAMGAESEVRSSASHSIALGYQSIATEANTLSVGHANLQRRIVNVANGRNATDAATVGQLRGALATLGGDVDANGNIINPTFNVQGSQQSTLNEALSTLDSAVVTNTTRTERVESQLRAVFQDSPSVRSDGLNQLTFAGANGMVLSNVANGAIAAGSRDAVNGGQLHSMQQQLNGRMDGLEQRIDGQPQAPQSRALTVAAVDSAASSAPVATPVADEPTATPPSSGDNKVVADAGNAPKSSPQPQADAPKPESPTPQVDTAELEKMLARANEYSDGISREVDARLDKMDKRFNRMAAMTSAQSAMAMNTAGLNTYNRLGAGVGYSEGESAMAVGYQRVLNDKGSATFSLNGAFTNSGERSMGVGVGIGW